MLETNISKLCQLEASKLGAIMWRNNVGRLKDATGRMVSYGVCNPGGADLIGIYKGRFVAIEVKRPGKKTTEEQESFLEAIRRNGGIAGVCYSPEDVKKLLT